MDIPYFVGGMGGDAPSGISVHDVRKVAPDAETQLSAAASGAYRRTEFHVLARGKGGAVVRAADNAGGRERRTFRGKDTRNNARRRVLRRADAVPQGFFYYAAVASACGGCEADSDDKSRYAYALAENGISRKRRALRYLAERVFSY